MFVVVPRYVHLLISKHFSRILSTFLRELKSCAFRASELAENKHEQTPLGRTASCASPEFIYREVGVEIKAGEQERGERGVGG